jgi:3-hydroxypropionyl-CoA synthetase (ADP-forming)
MSERQLGFEETAELLREYGIDVQGRMASTRDEALAGAEEIGYPVAMKVVTPEIVHKTDVGVVALDLTDAGQAGEAYDRVVGNAHQAGAKDVGRVLVQKMARPGCEVMVGAKQDPSFGPVTMVGTGGRFVELWRDTAPGVGILERSDVEGMLAKTKLDRILHGFRGPPLDRDAVIDVVIKVSKLMEERHEVHELDLNPVIVYEEGTALVDARIIVGEPVHHPRATDLSYRRMKSLDAIFSPKSLAVVGASTPGSVGGIILKNSRRIENLYPVNPKREELLGLRCYPSIEAIEQAPDLGVFAIPPEATLKSFRAFCERGGRGAIVVSDGFAESGRKDLEDELASIAREHEVAYVGPNCLGVIDNYSGLNTMFIPERRTGTNSAAGTVGVISQSGGIGLELLEMLNGDNVSVGKWVSCGNASGVAIPEILAHMGDDPRIRAVAIYLEGLQNGLQFTEVAKSVTKKKPVIVIKGGVGGGAAKTMSHTASLAGSFEAFRAACEQAGVVLISELTEDPKLLTNVLSLISTQPAAQGDRVAVVSVGGGAAILLADQITREGLRLAEFSEETKSHLAGLFERKIKAARPEEQERVASQTTGNPVDLFADCDDDMLLEALTTLDKDPNTDIVVVAAYFQVPLLSEYIPERLLEVQRELTKPLILSPRGYSKHVWDTREYLTERSFQTYTVPVVKALAIAEGIWRRYSDTLRAGSGEAVASDGRAHRG